MWWALRTFAPVVHAATGGPWSHGSRPTYAGAPAAPPAGDPGPSVRRLVQRYLEGFGPATAQDIGQFTILRMPVVGPALDDLVATGAAVRHEGPDGVVLHDVVDGLLPDEDEPAPPRLMAMWDSSLFAYADRERIIPAAHRPVVIRRNGDTLASVLVDGRVAGVWRPADGAAASRSPPSSGCRRRRGRRWPTRPPPSSGSSPGATPTSTAATAGGGRRSTATRCASSAVDVHNIMVVQLAHCGCAHRPRPDLRRPRRPDPPGHPRPPDRRGRHGQRARRAASPSPSRPSPRHVKVLEEAGLISRTQVAQSRPCRLEPERLDAALGWIGEQRRLWTERHDRLAAHLAKVSKR